jgi:hypothetical protein
MVIMAFFIMTILTFTRLCCGYVANDQIKMTLNWSL